MGKKNKGNKMPSHKERIDELQEKVVEVLHELEDLEHEVVEDEIDIFAEMPVEEEAEIKFPNGSTVVISKTEGHDTFRGATTEYVWPNVRPEAPEFDEQGRKLTGHHPITKEPVYL